MIGAQFLNEVARWGAVATFWPSYSEIYFWCLFYNLIGFVFRVSSPGCWNDDVYSGSYCSCSFLWINLCLYSLKHVVVSESFLYCVGLLDFCYPSSWNTGDDKQIHDRSSKDPCKTWWIDIGGKQLFSYSYWCLIFKWICNFNILIDVWFLNWYWCNCLTPQWQGIKQFFVAVEREEWKFDTLCDLYDTLTITQAVIFCNTKRKVNGNYQIFLG